MKKILLSLLVMSGLLSGCKKSFKEKAVQLNYKGTKLATLRDAKLSEDETDILALKYLDSATAIEPHYNSAYINKLPSLIYLKRYDQAIKTINIVLKDDPGSFRTYLKGGVIYQDDLKNPKLAQKYFTNAYRVAKSEADKNNHKKLDDDLNVARSLLYLKGKIASKLYIESIASNYNKEPGGEKKIIYIEKLIDMWTNDVSGNQDIITEWSTYGY